MGFRSSNRFGMRYFPATVTTDPFYVHSSRFKIKREHRGWDARSTGPGGRGTSEGRTWTWNVYDRREGQRGYPVESFTTLTQARAWCDEQEAPR